MLATLSSAAPLTWQDYAVTFGQMIAALAIMAAAAWAVTLIGRKRLSGRRKARFDLVDKMPLENGRGLWLVEVEGRRLLIGSSSGSVRLLCEMPGSEEGSDREKQPTMSSTAPHPERTP